MINYTVKRSLTEVVKRMRLIGYRVVSGEEDRYNVGDGFLIFTDGKRDVMFHIMTGRFTVHNTVTRGRLGTQSSDELKQFQWFNDMLNSIYEILP